MSNDFTRVQSMNAISTRPNFRRKSRKKSFALLFAIKAATAAYVSFVH